MVEVYVMGGGESHPRGQCLGEGSVDGHAEGERSEAFRDRRTIAGMMTVRCIFGRATGVAVEEGFGAFLEPTIAKVCLGSGVKVGEDGEVLDGALEALKVVNGWQTGRCVSPVRRPCW